MQENVRKTLEAEDYSTALEYTLNQKSAELLLFLCRSAQPQAAVAGLRGPGRTGVLLCLLQQLSITLAASQAAELPLRLAWLNEVALELQPDDQLVRDRAALVARVGRLLGAPELREAVAALDPASRRTYRTLVNAVAALRPL
eukprot:m51a1_g13577 hypothetical protein (143) ;mRNA; r:1685-2113